MNYFEKYIKILNLNENYSEEEFKKAYRKAVIENHPDKYQDETEKKQATERMKKINEAYGFLKNYNNISKKQTKSKNQSSSKNTKKKKKNQTSSFDDLIKILEYAINTQSQVKIKYINRAERVSERIILPFEIEYGLYEEDKIYLIAYCFKREKEITFRLDRILSAQRIKDSEKNSYKQKRNSQKTEEHHTNNKNKTDNTDKTDNANKTDKTNNKDNTNKTDNTDKKAKNKNIKIFILVIIFLIILWNWQVVSYNENRNIYHKPTCEWARKCTTNCHLTLKFLIEKEAKPCKVCKGK